MRIKVVSSSLALAALLALGAGGSAPVSAAMVQHSGQSGGHSTGTSGSTHDSDGGHEDSGARGKKGKASTPGESGRRGGRSLEDIFRDIAGEEEDSDRPAWAGGKGGKNDRGERPVGAGSARGTLYGDMYVILRDANGVPILNSAGFVQPIDANGNLIPLDSEGAPIDPTLAQEVELGRLNVGRSGSQVLDRRAQEVVTLLKTATAISTDPAGRLVITSPDGSSKTIDSPLENLAIYVALMTQGTIPGVTDLPGTQFDYLVDGALTAQDLVTARSLLAAASDKATPVSADAVAYLNAIVGINTVTSGDVTYSNVNYSSYSYDRSDTYSNVTATVLVRQPDGSLVPTTVNIYDAVFKNVDYSGTGTFAAFAQSVDDARAIINFIHEYEVPAVTTSSNP